MSFANGENVGPYRIIQQLGQGGMATVYKAYHPSLDRYVAIKALHPAMMEDSSFLDRFEREAKVVAKLEHPNIVPIYDFAEHAGRPYLVMKFIEGETLKARLSRGPLSKEEALKIITAVGDGLAYAHKRGYLHRDIKPSNVLLSPDGSIYLADFGLARIAEAGASTLSGDMLMGTPHYISPEQARGERELDTGTDIYSFGVVLYELVVGRVPFTADTPFSIIHDHIYTPLPMPRRVNPSVPEAIELVLLKALAKERKYRFQSVDDLIRSFQAAITQGALGVLESRLAVGSARAPVDAMAPTVVDDMVFQPSPAEVGEDAQPAEPVTVRGERRRWLWVAGGILMACMVITMALLALRDVSPNSSIDPDAPISGRYLESLPALDRPAPGDPGTHIERAEKLLEGGDNAAAYDELLKAAELFLFADEFVPAVEVYRRALELTDRPARAQLKLVAGMAQALFFGAVDGAMLPTLQDLSREYSDMEVIQVALARAELHAGQLEAARGRIEPYVSDSLDDTLAASVLAEIHLHAGDLDAAREIVDVLLKRRVQVPWLKAHLQDLSQLLSETK